jgi:hypothetical protein
MHHSKAQTYYLLPHSNINSTSFQSSLLWTVTYQHNFRDIATMVGYRSLLQKHLVYIYRSRAQHLIKWNKIFMIVYGVSSGHSYVICCSCMFQFTGVYAKQLNLV